ncbi:hypothetical protein Hypma_002306 [Hypsizygus marmoreus]|uniref:Uncharacterized protein n=1 Tax=Hypsizygus marmoreus TaxID=39966 RepID=A0A369K7T3_HYPMA|nr:hypothetical protein Hypma_002306 [Hypsizygus marmoreus]
MTLTNRPSYVAPQLQGTYYSSQFELLTRFVQQLRGVKSLLPSSFLSVLTMLCEFLSAVQRRPRPGRSEPSIARHVPRSGHRPHSRDIRLCLTVTERARWTGNTVSNNVLNGGGRTLPPVS